MALDYKDWYDQFGNALSTQPPITGWKQTVATGDRASALLNDANWVWCIKEWEVARDSAQKRADALREKLLAPDTVNIDEVNRLKNQLIEAQTYVKAWQMAIDTPERAIEAKQKAEERLKDIVGGN